MKLLLQNKIQLVIVFGNLRNNFVRSKFKNTKLKTIEENNGGRTFFVFN